MNNTPTYRQWLQGVVNSGNRVTGGQQGASRSQYELTPTQASALMGVVGDDARINQEFLADPYAYTGSDRGQVFSTNNASGENWGIGPESAQALNRQAAALYNELYGSAPGSGGGTGQRLNQVGVNAAQAQLGTLDAELARALAAEEQDYRNTRSGYDAEAAERLRQRDEGVTRNTQNYDSNLMASLRAGSRGMGGLMQLLRGSAGTAVERAQGAVADTTADDIRAGYDTNRENTEAITGAYNTFATSDDLRRKQLEDQYANNRMAAEATKFTRQQQLLNDLAGYYSQAGMNDQAMNYSNQATGLQPEVSARSSRQVSKITPQQANWQAPEITAFSGASAPDVITPTDQGRLGAGVFTLGGDERRRREVSVGV